MEQSNNSIKKWARSAIFLTNLCASLGEGSIGKCGELSYREQSVQARSATLHFPNVLARFAAPKNQKVTN